MKKGQKNKCCVKRTFAHFWYVILWLSTYQLPKIQLDNFLFHIKAIFWLFLPVYIILLQNLFLCIYRGKPEIDIYISIYLHIYLYIILLQSWSSWFEEAKTIGRLQPSVSIWHWVCLFKMEVLFKKRIQVIKKYIFSSEKVRNSGNSVASVSNMNHSLTAYEGI